MVKYVYDAWGNHEVKVLDSACSELSQLNRRYRGYYYDTETGLYFLKTRYYDPQVGRFITIDDVSYIDPEHINGLNLYAYCANNPVMNVDPEGTKWWHWLAVALAIVGAVLVIAAITVLTCGVGVVGGALAGTLIGSVIHGAAIGAVIGAGVGIVAGGLIGGAVSGWTLEGILTGMAIGFGACAIIGAIIGGAIGGAHFSSLSKPSIGKPFNPNGPRTQLGVDPNTLKFGRELNPNKIKAVTQIVKNDGMYGVIEVFRNGVIIDGNHRVFVAQMLGYLVDVVVH